MLGGLKEIFSSAVVWPSLEEEFGEYRKYFKGRVLNAGAGDRDISGLVHGEVMNQDIPGGLHNGKVDVFSSLDSIPVADGYFDAVVCNAVLEHVVNPSACVREFYRVLRKGGYLYLCIPFIQPEHADPGDYQRYTKQGLSHLVMSEGFVVERLEPVHSVYHTFGWLVERWLNSRRTIGYLLLRVVLFPLLRYKTRHSRRIVDGMVSAYRVLARK